MACGVATPSALGAASSTHHGRCHMRLVWSKTVGKSGCVIYKGNQWWGLVIHDNQIIGVGERQQRRRTTTITTTTAGRAGIRAYWGCLIIMSGDDWNDTTKLYIFILYYLMDGRHSMMTHTTTNQKQAVVCRIVRRRGGATMGRWKSVLVTI